MDINCDNFFVNDKLDIKDDVVGFAQLIEQEKYIDGAESAKVYAISAEFGIGKTFFCERLKDVLLADNVPVTKMNIWEMDFYEDPLIPILINIQEIYKQNNPNSMDFPNPSKMLNLFKSIVAGITIEAKASYIGKVVIDGEKIIKNSEVLKQKALDTDIYAEYKQYKNELDDLKMFLKNWAEETDKPIVIIIDELDRCRPDYAVKTLEVLKHFFDIPGFVFVLALDEKQLESSVKCLFGTENFDGYKRKFINNSFLLRIPDKEKFTNYLYTKSGIENTIEEIQDENRDLIFRIKYDDIPPHNPDDRKIIYEFNKWQVSEHIIKQYFTAYSIWFKFTLRQMEQVFDRLVLFTKAIHASKELFSPDLAVLLVCLHEFDIKIYNILRNHSGTIQSVLFQIYGNTTSFANAAYEDRKALAERFGQLNRNIIPQMPAIETYSKNMNSYSLHDNVDRFFNYERNSNGTLKYLIEARDKHNRIHNSIDTHGVLAVIVPSEDDMRRENAQIHDTATMFDLAKFKQSYFEKMDFVSRFIDSPPEELDTKYKTEATSVMHNWLKTLHPATKLKAEQIAIWASQGIYHDAQILQNTDIFEQPVNKTKFVYYIKVNNKLVFLLGGDKSMRDENIKQALELAQGYLKKNEKQ